MKIQLFVPCFIDQLYPETAVNAVRFLRKQGCEVFYNENQTCCGQPAYNAGFIKESQKVASKCQQDLSLMDMPIVCIGGSCTGFIKNKIPDLIHSETPLPIFEFTDFVVNHLNISSLDSSFVGRLTLHDACGALRDCGIKSEMRTLIQMIKGAELVEMQEAETCCGFGGTFSVKFEPISLGMAETKVSSALQTKADYIVSTDWSCLMHIDSYIKKHKLPIQAKHIIDLMV